MEMRNFGRTGLRISILGFGCGAVGGLMVRGAPADQERAIARALEAGVNYFDTAVQYGDGESEKNLGRALRKLKPERAIVGTKVRLPAADFGRIDEAVAKSLEGSLRRLNMERVDIFHLHNAITAEGGGESLGVKQVLDQIVPAFERLRQNGMIRFLGITAVGDTAALHQVIDARVIDSAQVTYNMLNPSAGAALPARYPAQNYGLLLDHARAAGVGVIGIRVRARRLMPLVEQGFAQNLAEAATRFAISHPAVGTILVGMATPEQFEQALAAVQNGPLPPAALDRLTALQQSFSGEAR